MSNKTTLQSHNERLQDLIDTANSLPDAGGGSGGAVETCTVYLPRLGGYEATIFENGTITYKQGNGEEVENVVRNSIFKINNYIDSMTVDGGSLLVCTNDGAFILVSGSIVNIYVADVEDPF